MKLFLVNLTYVDVNGFYCTECVIINAEDENEAEELIEKYIEYWADDRNIEHRSHPTLIDTTNKGVVFNINLFL